MLNCESCAQYRPIYRYSYFQLRIVCFQLQHILNTVFRYGYWNTFNRAGKFCSKQNWKKYVRKLGGFNLKNTRQCKRSQVKRKLISYKNIFENLWEWKKKRNVWYNQFKSSSGTGTLSIYFDKTLIHLSVWNNIAGIWLNCMHQDVACSLPINLNYKIYCRIFIIK